MTAKTEDKPEEKKKKSTAKKSVKKKAAKKASSESTESKEDKLAKLREKAAKLAGAVEELEKIDIKSKIKETPEEEKEGLVPIEDYLKSSIHLGTRVITPDMRPFVYKRRADGLAVFNTNLLDEKIKEGAEYLSQFSPEKIIIVCKREAGWNAVNLFSQATGIKAFTKKYPAGILTNPQLDDFIEADLIFICDPWIDKNALADANRIKTPVLSICDTNNYTKGISKIIPGNNKSAKSFGMIFYLLTKLYTEARGIKTEVPPIEKFIDDWENLSPPK